MRFNNDRDRHGHSPCLPRRKPENKILVIIPKVASPGLKILPGTQKNDRNLFLAALSTQCMRKKTYFNIIGEFQSLNYHI